MSKKIKIRIFLAIAVLCWCLIACWAMLTHQQGSAVDPIYDSIHGDIYGSSSKFYPYQGDSPIAIDGIVGGVLPNPENNAEALSEAMAVFSNNIDAGTVVVVAFKENAGKDILSGDWGWQGSYGVVQTEKNTLTSLKDAGLKLDNKVLGSVSELGIVMDYCSYYLQGVSVIPLVIDPDLSGNEISEALGNYKDIIKDYPVLVVPPATKGEQLLPSGDMAVISTLLADAESRDYSGIFQKYPIIALRAFGALLPLEHGDIRSFSYTHVTEEKTTTTPEHFSDLLIFCER